MSHSKVHKLFNNTMPIIQLKCKIHFNKSVPSTEQDSSVTYCNNNNLDEEEETQSALLNGIGVIYVCISNVSTSFDVKTHLNLRHLALNGYNVEYRHDQKQLFMKLRKPPVTACIRSSGKIVCVGTPSEHEAKIAAKRIARIIQKLGHHGVQFSSYKIVNVLGSCVLPFSIRLAQFYEEHKSSTQYEPELNPGVIYRITEFKATLTVYATGSITINAPSAVIAKRAVEHIYPLVFPFSRSKLLEDVCVTNEENQFQEQNTEVEELMENH